MYLYQGWYLHKEKENLFLTLCMANLGLTATSLFENLDVSVDLHQY